jgi:DNA replication protein DnaC
VGCVVGARRAGGEESGELGDRAARRIHDAGFPRDKRIEEFDFDANPNVNPAVIHQLASCAWVKAGHPLCLIGDSGTGKSHLLIGLSTAAAEAGNRVRYTLASKLGDELVEAADDKQLSKTIPATAALIFSVWMSWATWNSTGAAPNCSFKF